MFGNRAAKIEEDVNQESFTCTPYLLAVLLVLAEGLHSEFEDPIVRYVQSFDVPNWIHSVIPFAVSVVIIGLIFLLLERQSEVILEQEYVQIGNSPFHYFRADEMEEIKFKGGFLLIRTRRFWRTGRYYVKKEQRTAAHQLLNEWALQHDLKYIRIF
ncbi:MAG: hypothetical protein ACXVOI_09455 [Tumebacillaceae bacterium]